MSTKQTNKQYRPSLSQEEIDDIKAAAQSTLDAAIDSRLADIEQLRSELQNELSESRKRMANAAELNVAYEKQNLMERIDKLSNDFLNRNEDFRTSTKLVADADRRAGRSGKGVDWGSWGNVGGGEVTVSSVGNGSSSGSGGKKLLGSVDSARRRAMLLEDGVNDDDDEEESELAAALSSSMDVENRVLIVVDDKKVSLIMIYTSIYNLHVSFKTYLYISHLPKQDKGPAPVLSKLTTLLNDAFDANIIIDTYSPTTSNIPIGGNNAQTAIIFASSLNDRSSLESLLGRILKRTAPIAGGAPGMPPSHVVLISSLGTERTNKMPYSMQNLFGGKLDKLREIEQGLVAISRTRQVGKQLPLDYTIVKFGEVTDDTAGGKEEAVINIQPGDALDGEIGVNAAANVLIQAMAYRPYARNATLCTTGSLPADANIDDTTWNDKFLCLSGPELLRIDAGKGAEDTDDGILDSKYEQLRQYVKQWSGAYEGDRKGTGLTTPVLVRKSRKPAYEVDGVVARDGVRILFQTTNTGDRYKSASEERQDEKERSSGGSAAPSKKSSSSSSTPVMMKQRKEGGVEVLVEKTTDGNIRVRARRCNMDNKTIVKEMSEVVIVKSLKRAIEAWVNARVTTGF